MLVADLALHARPAKADCLVQRDRAVIGQRDPPDGLGEALRPQRLDQRAIEQPSRPAPLRGIGDIDARLDRPAIGRAGVEGAGIGIGEDAALFLALRRDHPGIEALAGIHPRPHRFGIGRAHV